MCSTDDTAASMGKSSVSEFEYELWGCRIFCWDMERIVIFSTIISMADLKSLL